MDRLNLMIDPAIDAVLRAELVPGEQFVWSVQPNPSKLYAAFAIWLFAIPWTVFALFWEVMASFLLWGGGTGTPDAIMYSFGIVFPLFGLPFIAVGLYMLWMPIAAMRKARQTVFALTDRRVLRVTAGKTREATSVMLDQMGPIDVRTGRGGYGTLRI